MKTSDKCTIHTIAQTLGVAPSTVSRAFAPSSRIGREVRNQILDYAREQGYTPNKTASRLSMKPLAIAVLYYDVYEYGVQETERGITDAYAIHSDLKIKYELISISKSQMTLAHMQKTLASLQDCDGLIITGFNDPEIIACFNNYAASGKPIVAIQNDVAALDCLCLYGLNAISTAKSVAAFIETLLKRSAKKNVVLFTGSRDSLLHRETACVFESGAESFGFRLLRSYDMKDDANVLASQIHHIYEEDGLHPDVVYITSGISEPLCDYFRNHELYKTSDLITFDLHSTIVRGLAEGIITATIYQNQYQQAKSAFTGLVNYLIGQPMNVKNIASVFVMKNNMEYYI